MDEAHAALALNRRVPVGVMHFEVIERKKVNQAKALNGAYFVVDVMWFKVLKIGEAKLCFAAGAILTEVSSQCIGNGVNIDPGELFFEHIIALFVKVRVIGSHKFVRRTYSNQ